MILFVIGAFLIVDGLISILVSYTKPDFLVLPAAQVLRAIRAGVGLVVIVMSYFSFF